MGNILISVVLCTFNPKEYLLNRTLGSLRQQTMPFDGWELLCIDNNSAQPVSNTHDLSWHPNARWCIELAQGLAHARRRGYLETKASLIIHADDDIEFASDYLEKALQISKSFPQIGCFGGQLLPKFERDPKDELERALGEARAFDEDRWSNAIDDTRTMPWGAAMCVRREVAVAYLEATAKDPRRLMLGRSGTRLMTGEDLDLNYTAIRAGFGTGLFHGLRFVHFVPRSHVDLQRFLRYKHEANGYSVSILKFLHFGRLPAKPSLLARVKSSARHFLRPSITEQQRRAWLKGEASAVRDMRLWKWV